MQPSDNLEVNDIEKEVEEGNFKNLLRTVATEDLPPKEEKKLIDEILENPVTSELLPLSNPIISCWLPLTI